MSIWYINKQGISLNEGGKWIIFSFVKVPWNFLDTEAIAYLDYFRSGWRNNLPSDVWLLRLWVMGHELICMHFINLKPYLAKLHRQLAEVEQAREDNLKRMIYTPISEDKC